MDSSSVGWGTSITYSFGSTGTHSITLTGKNSAGASGSANVNVVVDPAPPKASVQIVSPANGASFIVSETATSYPVNLIASGSTGMQFSWSLSIDGNLGNGANITPNLTVKYQGNCAQPTTHTITLHGQDNLGRTASASITVNLDPSCIK